MGGKYVAMLLQILNLFKKYAWWIRNGDIGKHMAFKSKLLFRPDRRF